jgi:2'-5' RNA ligase
MPFKVNERKKEKLVQTLKEEIAGHNPFRVELKNFDCFAPRVIFVRVLPNEKLMSLQRQIAKIMWTQNIFNGNYKDRAFHPHLTVAFRDLKKSDFHRAWDHFKSQELQFAFSVDQIELLKHGGKKWQIDESINF